MRQTIRLIRESRGYSQEWVAKKLDLTQQAYSSIEHDPENAKLSRLKDVARILGVSLIQLIVADELYCQWKKNSNSRDINTMSAIQFCIEFEKTIFTQGLSELEAQWHKSKKEEIGNQ
ncbi:MAG: helix-turn-helix transcriptional regulator [Bacteroidetes bacterium]|nr:helix-turn-helix transcriptional regulator [Bacteroidota bacterium]